MKSGWCYGTCIRTNARGDFPAECVYVLPTITKPTVEILVSNNTYNSSFLVIYLSLPLCIQKHYDIMCGLGYDYVRL